MGAFDDLIPQSPSGAFDDLIPPKKQNSTRERTWGEAAADTGIDAVKGAVGLVESGVGLADLATGNLVGDGLSAIGYDPKRAKQILSDLHSAPRQEADQNVGEAKGFTNTVQSLIDNPSTAVGSIVESTPMMLGGVTAVRALASRMLAGAGIAAGTPEAAAFLSSPAVIAKLTAAGAGSEGAMTAGSIQEAGRQAGRGYWESAPSAVAGGLGTAAISVATSKIPGLRDAEVGAALAGMGGAQRTGLLQAGKEIAKGVFKEGALEEMPQSAQEQIFTNLATGVPWDSGVPEAAAQGLVVGAGMGGGLNTYSAARNGIDEALQNGNSGDGATPPVVTPSTPLDVPTEAEKALHTPVKLTALDRAHEIDTELAQTKGRLDELTQDNGYGPTFDQERDELAAKVAKLSAERDSISQTWPKATPGAQTTFSTEAGARLDGQYALMNAGDLVTSHDENLRANPKYPSELQPRDRSRSASELQVSGIVQKLDPVRLGHSGDAATGAPIVGADGLVESGNARTIALKRVYQANGQKAADYKSWLRDNAAQFGITPESVDAMDRPVLVRVRSTPVNRAEFARQANASTVQRMSSSEQALADAKRLTSLDGLEPDDSGDFTNSRDFIRQFMGTLPITEQSDMIEADGKLSTTGYRRIQNAVLAKAYGDSPTLRRMTESIDDNLRNISKSLVRVAPLIASSRAQIDAGVLHDVDIATDLLAAVEGLSAIKDKGWSVKDELGQGDLTGSKYSTEAIELLEFLSENIRSPRRIAEFLQRYYEALEAAGNPNQEAMFEDLVPPTKSQLLKEAKPNVEQRTTENTERGNDRKDEGTGQQGEREPTDAQSGKGSDKGDENKSTSQRVDQNSEWKLFATSTGTLGIPRAEMPQIKSDHRGALIQFLSGKDIEHKTIELPANELKPTQAEYSPQKIEKWSEVQDGVDRSVLASSDGYILDGHHQWMAALEANEPIKVIQFDVPITQLLAAVFQFPSVQRSDGAGEDQLRESNKRELKDALADLTMIATKHTRLAMVPEKTPDLMPTLVRLMEAGIKEVGYNIKDLIAYVKNLLKQDPQLKTFWNKITTDTYRKAAELAVENVSTKMVDDLFAAAKSPAATQTQQPKQESLFSISVKNQDEVEIDGEIYSLDADNFGANPPAKTLVDSDPLLEHTDKKSDDSLVVYDGIKTTRGEMHDAIVDAFFDEKSPAPLDRKPIAYVLGGGGASGKGTIKRKLRQQGLIQSTDIIDIDPDEIKQNIPEYKEILDAGDSRAASVVHEESSILSKRVLQRAMDDRYDMVLDVTLGDQAKGLKYLQNLKNAGYEVRLFGVTVDPKVAVIRAILRAERTGRYVPIAPLLAAHKGFNSAFGAYAELADQARLYETTDGIANIAEKINNTLLTKNGYNVTARRSELNEQATTLREVDETRKGMGRTHSQNGQQASERQGSSKAGRSGRTGDEGKGRGARQEDRGLFDAQERDGLDANSQPSQNSVEGEGASPSQESQQRGAPQRVRTKPSGRDLFSGGDADTNTADPRGLGQTGPDGMRSKDANSQQPQPRNRSSRNAGVPAGRDIPQKSGQNYAFGPADLTYEGSWFKKAEQNVEAIELLLSLEKDGRQATREEQAKLAKFIGWGASEIANNLFGDKLDKAAEALTKYDEAIAALGDRPYLTNARYNEYASAFRVLQYRNPQLNWYTAGNITREMLDKAKPEAGVRKWVDLRDRLKKSMPEKEWSDASRSTQYAHYTSKEVVRSMWRALERMGFKGGAVLEPGAGIGVFPGLMPAAMAVNSIYTGIEFDSFTGRILKQLFPDERILVESFVDSKLPKNFYDVSVGNPPFSGTKILSDPEYAKRAFSLHDYFFAKSIDRTKPGGLVVYVTSRYTMDKLDDKARQYLAERADLVGAIRLPQTAFKQNAGTEVVTDVIFLRKKLPGENFEGAQSWGKSVPLKVNGNDYNINEYFVANPDMVLGTHSDAGSMYKDREYTVAPLDGDIEALFDKAINRLPEGIYTAERGSAAEAAKVREIDFNPKAKKEGNYYVSDAGALMVRESGVGQRVELRAQADMQLIKDFVPLRDALKQAHYDQLNDGDWETSIKTLQKSYADFTKKHGQINQFTLKSVKSKMVDEDTGEAYTDETQTRVYTLLRKLEDDPDYTLVAALETINEDTGEIKPSAFLTERVLGKPDVASVNTPIDALLSSLNDVGHVDIPLIAQRVGLTEAETIEALGSAIYDDPAAGWVTADEYLSGNVKRKLDEVRTAAKTDKRFERNVAALEGAQPAPKTPSQINVGIGMNWVPGAVYSQFLRELAGVHTEVSWNARTKQWSVQEISGGKSMQATADWGTADRNVTDIMEHALTGRPIRITKSQGYGKDKTTVFDAAGTEAANQKLEALREAFGNWVWKDADRTDSLVRIYNDTFNTTVPRSFDGRHLTLPGTSKSFSVFDHVKRGAWRIIQRGNTYLAHAVGSGKTFQMVISAMEQKRLGLIKKPMIVVPNHMLKQFSHEWQMLYPAARLMVADEKNFHTDNRRRFVSRVALSDLDGVVITHSAFKLLDLDPEFKRKMIEEQLNYMRAALEEAEAEDGKGGRKSPRIKQIEKQIENMEQKLEAAMASTGKDSNVRFDELGVDMLYVDEAHEFRKLDFTTSRQVKGISPQGSARSFDLYMKSRYLEQKNPGRSLVMASGTPVTNTLAELYTVQKFMDRQALEDRDIEDFDSWASMFGRERTVLEPNAAGKYEPVTRFSKFVNVPELTQMFREYADVLTSDNLAALLGDKRPKVEGGSRKIIVTPKTSAYDEYQSELSARVQRSRDWKPTKDEPNNPDPMIRIIGDGRLAAIDMRFVDPTLPSDPDSKLNRMIDDVIRVLNETKDMEYRDKAGNAEPNKGASMMVFSDLGFGAGVAANRGFNARAWFEKRLREDGVPMSQVAFMSDYKKSADKLQLFKDVNAGRVRLLVGSSKNMGTGVNAQQRLKALFHLDSPWYPADLEQREGRIVRQGNKNPLVQLYAYAAKGTYDENMWKMLASKQFFIDQALSGDVNLRELEDLDSQSQYDLAAAMVAEDPRVLQLAGARAEIEKLQRLYRAHEDQRARFKSQYDMARSTVDYNEQRLPEAERMAALVQDLSGDKFRAKAMGKTLTERTDWAESLIEKYKDMTARGETKPMAIGEISGFPVVFSGATVAGQYMTQVMLSTPDPFLLIADAGTSPIGVAMRAQNAIADVSKLPNKMRERIAGAKAQIDALTSRLDAPFPMAGMLADKVKEVNDLEDQIAFDSKATATDTQADANEDTKLSRGAGSEGMDFEVLDAMVKGIKAKMPNMPKVHVLSDPSKAPRELREYIIRQDAWHDVEGAMHRGELYMFASGLSDPLRAEHVLVEHEAAHFGLRAVMGDSLKTAMALVYANNADVRKAVFELKKRNKLSNTKATEEVIVDIPTEQLAKLKGWRKVTIMVRDWLLAHGYENLANKITDWLDGSLSQQERADLFVAELVRGAREYVAGKQPKKRVGYMGDTLLSTTLKEDIERQEKWLQAEARARGYKDIEDLMEKDYQVFEKLAEKWRNNNPAENGVLLSRKKETTQRAEDIIQTKAESRAPVDAIFKTLSKLSGIERLTGAVYNRAAYLLDRYTPETVKAGVVSDYGVPNAVIDQRVLLQGRQRVQLRKAGELIDKLSTLTRDESRVAYEWMNMDGADPKAYVSMMQGLPEESVKVLQDVQAMIDKLSREAVQLGQLSEDAYKANRFAYLRRSYAKHILEQTQGEKAKRARVISILGDQYKGRGMTEAASMKQIQASAPEWWGRKMVDGKADTALKGQKFVRLERRTTKEGDIQVRRYKNGKSRVIAGTREVMANPKAAQLEGMDIADQDTKLREVVYWPAGESIPAKYAEWDQNGTWDVRDVKGDRVIFWRDYTKDERELMGEVDEARFAIAKTLHGMIHDVEVGRYLEWMAHNYAMKEGETIPGVVVEASERYLDTFKEGEWVRVPDSKIAGTSVAKYGKLAGRYLPGPVWNDLRQTVNGQFKPFGETYAKILSLWKTSKTALSPAVHMNNVMSNFVMADWHDVTAGHVSKALRIILGASKGDGKGLIGSAGNVASKAGIADKEAAREILNRYADSGGDIGSWATNEISKNQLEPLLESLEKELAVTAGDSVQAQVGVMSALQHAMMLRFPSAAEALMGSKPGKIVGVEASALIELYQAEDDVFRLAAWLKSKESGTTDIDAGKASRSSFLDYHINAPWIQAMRNSGWPFISYTYRAVPMFLETAGKKPHKLMKLMVLAGTLNALGVMLAGGGDDDERKLLPEEKAGKIWGLVPKLIRMPWNDANGSPVYLDIRRFIPVGDVFDVGAGHSAVPILPGMQPGGPLVLLGELLLNKSSFTGKEITLETDTAAQKAAKTADYLYKAFAPNLLGLPGTYATQGVADAVKGRTDAFGREMSVAQAVASSVGVKLGSYPADVLRRNLNAKAASEMAEIDKNIAQLKRQYQTNKISRDQYQDAVKGEAEKQAQIIKGLNEKVRQ